MKKWFLILSVSLIFHTCTAQTSSPFAPETGTYEGTSYTLQAGYQYGFDLISGFGMKPAATLSPSPSILGPLKIKNQGNNQGTYALPQSNMEGRWTYLPDSHLLQFDGPLKSALKTYRTSKGEYQMEFIYKMKNGSDFSFHYAKKASKAFPKHGKPNGALTGTLVVKPDFGSIGFFDVAKGVYKSSLSGGTATTNKEGVSIAVGFASDPNYYDIAAYDSQGSKISFFTHKDIRAKEWYFMDYKQAVLNHSHSRAALLGIVPKKWNSAFSFTPSYRAICIGDAHGNLLGKVEVDLRNFKKPAFLADDRLVYTPKGGGLAITNKDYTDGTRIYDQQINMFAISPNEEKVAFSEGLHFYTMNLDGTNKQRLQVQGEPVHVSKADNVADIAWSPDGKFLAVYVKNMVNANIVVVPLDGNPYFYLKDENGDVLDFYGGLISWY